MRDAASGPTPRAERAITAILPLERTIFAFFRSFASTRVSSAVFFFLVAQPMRSSSQGFRTAMRVLDKGRLTIGAAALGASQKLLELCIQRVKRRIKDGVEADKMQSNQFTLADMATEIHAARQMLYHAAWLRDQGNNVTHEASMVKLFCTETASKVADKAMDIFEDEGYLKKFQIEMYLRDVRLYRIFEGTSEIQRLVISRNLLR